MMNLTLAIDIFLVAGGFFFCGYAPIAKILRDTTILHIITLR